MSTHNICFLREVRKILVMSTHNICFCENICCVCSLEVPHRGTSNENTQHMFSWRNKKNIHYLFEKKMYI